MSPPVYDYLLYYECAANDWLPNARNNKINIVKSTPGKLIDYIDWNVKGSITEGDSGGLTKCGVIQSTWAGFYNKAGKSKYGLSCGPSVNNMRKKDWLCFIDWYSSGATLSANDACKLILFQNKWGSGNGGDLNNLLSKLKTAADNNSYKYKTSGGIYEKLADATFAFKNPMDAFQIIRNHRAQFLFNISGPNSTNKKFRTGWLRRCVGSFQDDGLYIAEANELYNIPYDTSIHDRMAICNKLKGKGNYIKICDWGNMPTNPEQFDDIDVQAYVNEGVAEKGNYSPKFSSGLRDPHLRKSNPVVLEDGMLLGSSFKVK